MKVLYVLANLICLIGILSAKEEPVIHDVDVCVYGGTASGVTAALAAHRRGLKVIIVEPMKHLGGIAGGGIAISWDCLYKDDIGGIAKELHVEDSKGHGDDQWRVRQMLKRKVEEAGIPYFTEFRIDGKDDVVLRGKSIEKINLNYAPIMDEGVPPPTPQKKHALTIKAKVFIDAGYEGDLMAFSGVSYTTGREAQSKYKESLAGQRSLQYFDVDPYIEKGNSESGLLPMISSEVYEEGAASRHCMAYNFRLKGFSSATGKNRTPLKPLTNELDSEKYALAIRALKDQPKSIRFPFWNYARNSMISTHIPGRQSDYADNTWGERSVIWRDAIEHVKIMAQLGGMNSPSLIKNRYPTNGDFPDQYYIRLGRRMLGDYVMTQDDLMYQTKIEDSVGLAYYGVDLYPARLVAHKGKVASEGNTFVRVSPGPYPISYRSLVPAKGEINNLVVSVCMSASHVAMASIRMESGYVVMGEAAGIIASHAIKSFKNVQNLNYELLLNDMNQAGVITKWDGKGYGPKAEKHWKAKDIHWEKHPEDYTKIPLQLNDDWKRQ